MQTQECEENKGKNQLNVVKFKKKKNKLNK